MAEMIHSLINVFRQGFPCLFHLITGLYCPGCGGTRACRYLLAGDLEKSLRYHPLVLYMAVVVFVELGSYALSKILKRPGLYVGRSVMFTYIGVGIAIANWIFKNYMLVVRGIDLLP